MNAFPPRFRAFRFTLLPVLVFGCAALSEAAPPPAPPPKEEDSNFFKRVGNALFKKTRDFEKSQEPPKPLVPPAQARAKPTRKTPSPPNAAGQPIPGVNSGRRGETQYLREDPQTTHPDGREKVPTTDGKPKTEKGAEKAAANEFVGPPAPLSYATPVAGRAGYVYPPGAERTEANMLDVRGLAPGQKARDPRTGSMFLVP